MPTVGNSTVTLSNPTLALHEDGNVVSAIRSDNGATINLNVGNAVSNEDIQAALNSVALALAQQDAVASALVQTTVNGSATSVNGTSDVALHPYTYTANADGLAMRYTLSSVADQSFVINLGVCGGTEQSDVDAFAASALALLQTNANAAAQVVRDTADAQVGISTLTGTGSATVTI
jgi:hypothetical protein